MYKKIFAMVLSFALALSVGFPTNAAVLENDSVTIVEEETQLEKSEQEVTEKELEVEEIYAEEGTALYSAGNSFAEATAISFEQEYSGMIYENTTADYYKFELESSGEVKLDATAQIPRVTYKIYDSQGNKLWSATRYWDEITEQSVASISDDLTKGAYYFVVEEDYYTGNYNFELSFTSANESFTETGYGTNNGMSTANVVDVNTNYKGQIAYNDDKDFYKITIDSSGRLILDVTAQIRDVQYRICDEQGNALWSGTVNWDDTTKQSVFSKRFDLTKGTYYFVVEESILGYTGNYNFKLSFTSAKESFGETGYGTNNEMSTASEIKINTKYKGQIAWNDDKDFYKFTLDVADNITINATAEMYRIIYGIYDSQGNVLWRSNYYYWNETTKKSIASKNLNLAKGTYYFLVEDSSYVGNYSFNIEHSHVYKEKTTKATLTENGKIEKLCSCGEIHSSKTIYYPKTIKLDKTSYVYNGKVRTPSVIVKDSKGKTLKKGTDYTVSMDKGRKKVGEYDVKVTLKGKYQGTKTLTFTIKPKACEHTSTKSTITRATTILNGKVVKKCTKCNKVIKTTTIQNVSLLKLNKTTYVYDGEVKTPSVIVKDAEGKKLKEGIDYTVSMDKGRKKVGKYNVKVTLKGKYKGTKTLSFTIKE